MRRSTRAKTNKKIEIRHNGNLLTFVPTSMRDFSHIIYLKGTSGPIGWLPSGIKIDEVSAAAALRGDYWP